MCVLALFASVMAMAQDSVAVFGLQASEQQLNELVPVNGSVYSAQKSDLTSQVDGWVSEVLVDTGDAVTKGSVLMTLDSSKTLLFKEEAIAVRDDARVVRDHKKALLDQALSLVKKRGISEAELRVSKSEYERALTQLRVANAQLKKIELDLSRHVITAPFSGTVSERHISVGEWAKPGTPLLELIDSQYLKVDFQVPQRFFPRVDASASLDLHFDAYPEKVFHASIEMKVPVTTGAARTFLLRGAFPHSELDLIPGMSVSGQLKLQHKSFVVIPRDALVRYPDGRVTVWVAENPQWEANVHVREKPVKLGISSEGWVEVVSGLESGEVVITVGNEGLQSDQLVLLRKSA